MAGEVQAPRTFVSNWHIDGRMEYSDGSRIESFKSKNPDIGLILLQFSSNSTPESPNMTKKEYLETLHSTLTTGYTNNDCPVTAENLHQFAQRVEPYQTEDSDGGSDVTVAEMMKIADSVKNDYDEKTNQKPWYKFW